MGHFILIATRRVHYSCDMELQWEQIKQGELESLQISSLEQV